MTEKERKGWRRRGEREREGSCCMLKVTVRDTARCLLRYTTLQYYKDCLKGGDRFYSPSFNVHFIYLILFLY
jgi:hypothetical protein